MGEVIPIRPEKEPLTDFEAILLGAAVVLAAIATIKEAMED